MSKCLRLSVLAIVTTLSLKAVDWGALKPKTPFGALPTLEYPGQPVLAQSNALLVLIGRRHGVHPKDDFEAARHEAILQHCEDLRGKLGPTLRMTDEAEKKKAREAIAAEYIPGWAAAVEKQIGDGPFFGGKEINVADVKLFVLYRWLGGGKVDHIPASILSGYPKLTRLHDAVRDHERVKAWYAKS